MLNSKMSSLSGLAVRKFTEENIPLNETIAKIAEQEKLGSNHIARLVERSNRDTFLALYPQKASFEVASVSAVLKALNRQSETRNPKSEIRKRRQAKITV